MVAEPLWFTVRYGDDESQLFNSDCWGVVLLEHIQKKCGYAGSPEEFDLVQEDGTRMYLRSIGKQTARGTLTPKYAYILVKIVVDDNGAQTVEQLWRPPPGYEPPVQKVAPVKKK